MLTFINTCLLTMIAVPGGREFLRMVMVELISLFLFRQDADPEYRRLFLELTAKLPAAQTEEEKRAILQAIQALRPKKP